MFVMVMDVQTVDPVMLQGKKSIERNARCVKMNQNITQSAQNVVGMVK